MELKVPLNGNFSSTLWEKWFQLMELLYLQSALFTLTGSCTLILALRCVELVGELDTDALIVEIQCAF